jgi:hypothetical protein
MSRTYRNVIKQGRCYGSNTEFYRDMNRKVRNKNKHTLRNLLANNDIETVNDMIMSEKPIHDSWNEPTDGSFLISKTAKRDYSDIHYWNRKLGKYLKPKNRKHYKIV